jgi:hypothetical protein
VTAGEVVIYKPRWGAGLQVKLFLDAARRHRRAGTQGSRRNGEAQGVLCILETIEDDQHGREWYGRARQ